MSLSQLEALWLEQPVRRLLILNPNWRRIFIKSLSRTKRNVLTSLSSQYYLTSALKDSRQALRLNEDITLACLMLAAVMTFSVSNIFTSAVYQYLSVANTVSDMFGTSIIILILLSLGVMTVSVVWLLALLQNSISISLMDGLTRKKNRSLVLTYRRSLKYTSRTSMAWLGLIAAAAIPSGMILIIAAAAILLLSPTAITVIILFISAGVASILWLTYVLSNYSLVPYLMLFDSKSSWSKAITDSRLLVSSKGRWFTGFSYLALAGGIYLAFGLTQTITKIIDCNSVTLFAILTIMVLFLHNVCLTMFYRKRRLARK
jgi:hypothetical protein